jgi:hypothetical protein
VDDQLLKEAVVECGDEFLNQGAAPRFIPDPDGTHVEAFVEGECARFASYLRGYIYERLNEGDFVGHEEYEEVVQS